MVSKKTIAISAAALIAANTQAFAANFESLYRFTGKLDGAAPYGELLAANHVLYGTTSQGGTKGNGTVFMFDPRAGTKTILYNVHGGDIGRFPDAPLLLHNGSLVTTNVEGGSQSCLFGCGTAFSVDATTGAGALLFGFPDALAGETPTGGLTYAHGAYYGTTYYGGSNGCFEQLGCGIVYRLNPTTGAETIVHRFHNRDEGSWPDTGVTLVGSSLYGTTTHGSGTACDGAGCGTIFRIDLPGQKPTVVYRFTGGDDGSIPESGLLAQGGLLYGATQHGGGSNNGCTDAKPAVATGCGTIFVFDPATGAETVLYRFQGFNDGALPSPSRLVYLNGLLYGTTPGGGGGGCSQNVGCGTIFSVDATSGAETVLHQFTLDKEGTDPYAGLTYLDGALYGVTSDFSHGQGTIFRITP
jgi:uncharacterized repeat protein (TIGR03803 family)